MVQNAIVKRLISPEVAEVSLLRQMECGLSCKDCEGCAQKPTDEILALAQNGVGAVQGSVVEVESNAGNGIGIAALVFLLPCVGLALGYWLGVTLGLPEVGGVLAAFGGAVVGFIPAVTLNRAITRRKTPEFTILSIRG